MQSQCLMKCLNETLVLYRWLYAMQRWFFNFICFLRLLIKHWWTIHASQLNICYLFHNNTFVFVVNQVHDTKIKVLANLKQGTDEERAKWKKLSTTLKVHSLCLTWYSISAFICSIDLMSFIISNSWQMEYPKYTRLLPRYWRDSYPRKWKIN